MEILHLGNNNKTKSHKEYINRQANLIKMGID
jgi:hypothetical protein